MVRPPRSVPESLQLIELQGFPYPDNIALASRLESVVRVNGGVPATIGVINGVARVGLEAEELIELTSAAEKKTALKVSRRDLGYICGLVQPLRHSVPGPMLKRDREWPGRGYMAARRSRARWCLHILLVSRSLEPAG